MNPTTRKPISYFICYARREMRLADALLAELQLHLGISKTYQFEPWRDDARVLIGENWDQEIQSALAACPVGLLLLTPAFFNSDYITTKEVPRLLAQHESGEKVLIPVLLKPVDFGLQTTHGVDQLQCFGVADACGKPRAFSEFPGGAKRDAFAMELYKAIERRLAKVMA